MSRDPIRLADQADPLSPEAELMRGLIRARGNARPTAAKMDELAGRLGPILEPKAPAPASGMTWLAASVAAVTAVVVVTIAVRTTTPTEAVDAVVSASAPADREEVQPLPEPEPAVEPDAPRAVSVDALPTANANVNARKAPAAARCDEVMLVDDADTALRSGNPERALAVVREIEQRCTAGVLVQERERIAIEALAKSGRVEQARARARTFEARFPTSPHLRRVRQVAE